MAETAFVSTKIWCEQGIMLAINNKNIRKLYDNYKAKHDIGYAIELKDGPRKKFEEETMKLLCQEFRVVHHRDFAYPGTDYDRQLFTKFVNALDVDSIIKKGSKEKEPESAATDTSSKEYITI